MTGPPIYLVSACTNGEQFVAAFRRYADKNGLFIPIADPFSVGRRARFAVTLGDGGVMIEGEAEVASASRAPSVVHGRVGMTLRFLEPDETLAELEKARLAMRPAPPTTPPRPASIPAQPRPIPPPIQGRIDAFNALAECVAIGPPELLGPRLPAATLRPKAGPRFVVPVVPAVPARSAATTPAPSPIVNPGPISDTLVAPIPPAPTSSEMPVAVPRTGTRQGPAPAPALMPTLQMTVAEPITAPQIPIAGLLTPPHATPVLVPEETSARTQVHAGAPRPEPATVPMRPLSRPGHHSGQIEVDLAEPTDLSLMPPTPPERKTAIGVAIPVPEALGTTRMVSVEDHADEITGNDRIDTIDTIDTEDSEPHIAPMIDDRGLPPAGSAAEWQRGLIDEPTPIEAWSPPQGSRGASDDATPRETLVPRATALAAAPPTSEPTPAPAAPEPAAPAGGDWLIARDPAAPDGWSSQFATAPTHEPHEPAPASREAPPAFHAVPPAARRSARIDQLPAVEPKVQIDPTLIEPAFPLHAMSLDEQPGLSMAPGMATPVPGSFIAASGSLLTASAPAYGEAGRTTTPHLLAPLGDPPYPMAPAGMPPGGAAAGFGDPRFTSSAALPAQPGRRRAIIVIISAIVAVAIGTAVLTALTAGRAADTVPAAGRRAPSPIEQPAAAVVDKPSPADSPPPTASAPAPSPAASPTIERVPATAPASACFADITSVPTGAEIVHDQTVVGTTPHKLRLPCGDPVSLVIRKGRLPSVARTVTPTVAGAKLRVTLPRQAFVVKVSSSPEGAAITLNGKQVGVTPTTVRVPAFESSTLRIVKDGYEVAAETVAPKSNGTSVRAQLKKLDRPGI